MSKRIGARLWLKPARERTGKCEAPVWIIRDGARMISTGFKAEDKAFAEIALQDYMVRNRIAWNGERPGPSPETIQKLKSILRVRLCEAQTRARAIRGGRPRDWECTLTLDFLIALGERQGWRCALTGIPFELPSLPGKNNPRSMSLDRIRSSSGYTQHNVRLVLYAINVALGSWGEEEFRKIATAMVLYKPGAISADVPPMGRAG